MNARKGQFSKLNIDHSPTRKKTNLFTLKVPFSTSLNIQSPTKNLFQNQHRCTECHKKLHSNFSQINESKYCNKGCFYKSYKNNFTSCKIKKDEKELLELAQVYSQYYLNSPEKSISCLIDNDNLVMKGTITLYFRLKNLIFFKSLNQIHYNTFQLKPHLFSMVSVRRIENTNNYLFGNVILNLPNDPKVNFAHCLNCIIDVPFCSDIESNTSSNELIKTICTRFKILNNPSSFYLFVEGHNGYNRQINGNQNPLSVRISLGPCEDTFRIIVKDYEYEPISPEVAKYCILSLNALESIDTELIKKLEMDEVSINLKFDAYKDILLDMLSRNNSH